MAVLPRAIKQKQLLSEMLREFETCKRKNDVQRMAVLQREYSLGNFIDDVNPKPVAAKPPVVENAYEEPIVYSIPEVASTPIETTPQETLPPVDPLAPNFDLFKPELT